MQYKKSIPIFAISCIISYIFMYGFYLLMSSGLPDKTLYLQLRRYIPNAILIGISIVLWKKSGFSWFNLCPYAIISLSWAIVYPLSYWLTFHKSTNFIDNHFDISFAAYIFVFITCLHLLLSYGSHTVKQQKLSTSVMATIQTLLVILPIIQILYYYMYQNPITENACMALLQTNTAEAHEYLMQTLGYTGIISIIFLLVLIFATFLFCNKVSFSNSSVSKKIKIITSILFLSSGIYSSNIFKETGAMDVLHNAQEYYANAQLFNTFHEQQVQNLSVIPPQNFFSQPSTIIMIIGESASSDYMSAYHQTTHDTTPWMRTMSKKSDFILFRHTYTTFIQTVASLERALTEKNQYNNIDFNKAITVIDIAKKAGYHTYWFSNQGTISSADTPITLVAKTADHSTWIEDELANSDHQRYDGDLLPYLKQVNPNQNNFIVIHIMGSHDNYINRYPSQFTRWGEPGKFNFVINYENSIAYTDWLLQQIYDYGKQNLNLQVMLYFSDHGADPLKVRNPDRSTFVAHHIPMFLYLSKSYRQLYPQTYATLRRHENSYFTNDLIYELVCGILNITSNHYDATNSLASNTYKYTRDTLVTEGGKVKLTDDDDWQK